MMALHKKGWDYQSYYNLTWDGHEYLYRFDGNPSNSCLDISLQTISQPRWSNRTSHSLNKVIGMHPLKDHTSVQNPMGIHLIIEKLTPLPYTG